MDSALGLARLRAEEPGTEIWWAMRSAPNEQTFGGLDDDQLAGRGALGERSKAAVDSGAVTLIAPFRVKAFELTEHGVAITGETGGGDETTGTGKPTCDIEAAHPAACC